ncbi:MAG: hypothetical protein PF569_00080 [Candidatus Woesearchaeota archaeon]|jgi:parvulin-like peptidyl-prolyl isomerase|nr:hypothetical protein [Candidatus Woesearchaeota archaeon]
MMKKINAILLNLVLLMSMTSLVFAEDEVVISNDAIVLADSDGAQVRLLQLEARVETQNGNSMEIINRIKSENSEFDVTRLEEINSELESIREKISQMNLEEDATVLAAEYVELKQLAIKLSSEYREIAQGAFTDEVKEQIREEHRNNVQNQRLMQNQRLEEAKNNYNAKKTEQYMNKFGINNSEFVEQVRLGQADMNQVKEQLKQNFNNMDQEKKNTALREMNNEKQTLRNEFRERFPNAAQGEGIRPADGTRIQDGINTKRGLD